MLKTNKLPCQRIDTVTVTACDWILNGSWLMPALKPISKSTPQLANKFKLSRHPHNNGVSKLLVFAAVQKVRITQMYVAQG